MYTLKRREPKENGMSWNKVFKIYFPSLPQAFVYFWFLHDDIIVIFIMDSMKFLRLLTENQSRITNHHIQMQETWTWFRKWINVSKKKKKSLSGRKNFFFYNSVSLEKISYTYKNCVCKTVKNWKRSNWTALVKL